MNINFCSPINKTSYGICSAEIMYSLRDAGHNIAWFGREFGPSEIDIEAHPDAQEFVQKITHNSYFPDPTAVAVRLFHQFNMGMWPVGSKRIGFPIFELNTLSKQEKLHLSFPDEIFVPSIWAKEVLLENGVVRPIHVTPLGYNPAIFYRKPPVHTNDTFKIGNISKYEVRKNQDGLVNIFNRAFETTDDVALYLSCENIFDKQGVDNFKKRAKNTKLGDKIHFIPRLRSQKEINDLHNCLDVECYPSKAEGWNMPAHESLVCGNPTILTNYSAHSMFANKDEATLVDIDEMETANDGIWFKGQGEWAKIGPKQEDGFAGILKELYRNRPEKRDNPFARSFTWEHTVNKIIEAI